MKKVVLFILLVFMLTGCTANYTLKYDNDQFTEYVEITGDQEDDGHPTYADLQNGGYSADIKNKELFQLDSSSSRYDVKLSHVVKAVPLEDLRTVSECFNLDTIKETENVVSVSLYGGFTCDYLENSTFTLETDNAVINHNADEVDGNKYIWKLTSDLNDEGISFQILKSDSEKRSTSIVPTWLRVVAIVLILGVAIGSILLLKKNETK